MGSLQTELTEVLSVVPSLEDRPKALVAIEMLIALISSGIVFGMVFRSILGLCEGSNTYIEMRN